MRRVQFFVHSLSHLVNDCYGSFLAPLLPLLAAKHDLGLAAAGLLATVLTLSASLFQPLWGWLSDRRPSPWFIVGGVFASGLFFSLMGVAPNVFILALIIFAGGIGISSFHPMATALANHLAAQRKGLAIALFITAGTTGYALGPVFVSCLVDCVGLERMPLAVIPAILMVVLWVLLGPKGVSVLGTESQTTLSDQIPMTFPSRPIILLTATSIIRAFVLLTFINFMSFHLQTLGLDLRARGFYLFALQIGDAVGSLIGGSLSDRLGRWRIILWTPLASLPLLFLFLSLQGALSLVVLFLAGICLFASAPAVLIASQKMMKKREGMASALQVGVAWGSAGLLMGPVGRVGEIFGVYQVLFVVAFLPLLMVALAWMLKPYRDKFEPSRILAASARHHPSR